MIRFSAIFKDNKKVLAQYPANGGDFAITAERIVHDIEIPSRKTFENGDHKVSYLTKNRLIYLCIADKDFDGYRIFSFLSKVAEEHNSAIKVNSKYGVQQWNEILAEVNPNFLLLMAKQDYHNTLPVFDKYTKVQKQIQDVKIQMLQNIEIVMNRGERLENLVTRTESLRESTPLFIHQYFSHSSGPNSRQLSKNCCQRLQLSWKNVSVLTAAIAGTIYILTSINCGLKLDHCFNF